MRLLLALFLCAGAACSSTNSALGDGGHGDGGETSDARDGGQGDTIVCSVPRVVSPPLPTHRALVVYDEFVSGPDPALLPGGFNGPTSIFLDAGGVLYFGWNELLRLNLDGNLIARSRNPRRPYDDSPVSFLDVAGSTDAYGVVVTYVTQVGGIDTRFCAVRDDSWPALEDCAPVPGAGNKRSVAAWDGSNFSVLAAGRKSWFAGDSQWLGDEDFPTADPAGAPLALYYLPDKAVVDWYGRDSKYCVSESLWVMPRSLDADAAVKTDLAPADFYIDSISRSTGDGSFAAFLSSGPCFKRWPTPETCYQINTWPASFLTIVGADDEPTVLRQPVPLLPADQLAWDGAHLIAVRSTQMPQMYLELSLLDLQGNLVGVAQLASELGLGPYGGKTLMGARLVAVGPNDYIVGYGDGYAMSVWIARFSLVPL